MLKDCVYEAVVKNELVEQMTKIKHLKKYPK